VFVVSLRVRTLRVREMMERSSRDDGRMVATSALRLVGKDKGKVQARWWPPYFEALLVS